MAKKFQKLHIDFFPIIDSDPLNRYRSAEYVIRIHPLHMHLSMDMCGWSLLISFKTVLMITNPLLVI